MIRLILMLAVIIGTSSGFPHRGRILGGTKAAPGQFPSLVAIHHPYFRCGGTIINNNWVLTVAYCTQFLTSNSTIVSGTNLANSGGTTHNITKWITHERYFTEGLKYNIGLVQIEDEFEFDDYTQPIEFIEAPENSTCTVAGWGINGVTVVSEELLFVEERILSYTTCYAYVVGFGNQLTCATAGKGSGICNGDDGGPLVCDGKLGGIASYAIMDCGSGNTDLFTKPAMFVDWINENIQS